MSPALSLYRYWSTLAPTTRLALAMLASIGVLAVVLSQLDPALTLATQALRPASPFSVILLNALPVFALLLVLLALTRRLPLALWLTLLLVATLFTANAAKLAQLQTPLLPADFRLLAEPGPAIALLGHYVKLSAPAILAILVAATVTTWLVRRHGMPRLVGIRRALLFATAAIVSVSLLAGTTPWRRLYNAQWLGFEPWALTESAGRAGLIGSLLLYHWQLGAGQLPEPDREAAIALLRAHAPLLRERLADAAASSDEPPDIIIVQSESIFDPARLNQVEPGRYLREFNRIARESRTGQLHVPTFGGGTIRTEFEVLTGAPLATLGGIQYPWLELDHARFPNLASVLARNGYDTTAIHPNGAAFWNRNRAFPELGFRQFIDVAAFDPGDIVGLFTSDAALTDRVLHELKDDDGPPQFIFAISMESHGPFDWRPGLDADRLAALPIPESLDGGGRYWFRNYLYLLDDADHELGRLADALKQRKRRSLLLFFGDHLPLIHTVYYQLGFDDGLTELDQPTPWLLLDTANRSDTQADTQSWLLPALLLDKAGIHDEAYFVVAQALGEALEIGSQPLTDDQAAAFTALAQLQLRGELQEALEAALDDGQTALDVTLESPPAMVN